MDLTGPAGLWSAVIAMGAYHGLNPGMGWPLAVSAALMEQRANALFRAVALLAVGHFAAMAVFLAPFGMLLTLAEYERGLRLAASALVLAIGLWLLINRRHPRFLARIPPHRLALWSFLIAAAHGAGLMLVPIYLGICAADADAGHRAALSLMGGGLGVAVMVALAHTAAMTLAAGGVAFGVYRWLGLRFLSRSWFNLDAVWALSLIVVGCLGLWSAF